MFSPVSVSECFARQAHLFARRPISVAPGTRHRETSSPDDGVAADARIERQTVAVRG
mgnify:CR=1 FL=1